MIDTHAHLNLPELIKDYQTVIARAVEAGVDKIIVPGTNVETSQLSVEVCSTNSHLYSAVGIHPCEAKVEISEEVEIIKELLVSNKPIIAVGEVGLDFYHSGDVTQQENLFREMIKLAKQFKLPLIIHSREAFAETKAILQESAQDHPTVIHCFTGSLAEAHAWLDAGCLLSFTGIITYPKNTELREMLKKLPLDRLLIETDAPYLAPQGRRGQVCEPAFVKEVAQCIADLKGLPLEEVDRLTTLTAERFFQI